jgi:hypothetical protein
MEEFIKEMTVLCNEMSKKKGGGIYGISLPPQLKCMGLPDDFPFELLGGMPRNSAGAIIFDENHPKVKQFIVETNKRILQAMHSGRGF